MNNLTIIIKTVVLTALLHMVAPHATAWGLYPVMAGPERNIHMVLHEDCLSIDDNDNDDDDDDVNITVDKDDLDGTEGEGGNGEGNKGNGEGNKGNGSSEEGSSGNETGSEGSGSEAPDQQEETLFVRVSDASQLADGDVVVIGNAASHALMSTQEEKKPTFS